MDLLRFQKRRCGEIDYKYSQLEKAAKNPRRTRHSVLLAGLGAASMKNPGVVVCVVCVVVLVAVEVFVELDVEVVVVPVTVDCVCVVVENVVDENVVDVCVPVVVVVVVVHWYKS